MDNNTDNMPPFWTNVAQYPWVQGPLLGASSSIAVTPLLKWTNHALKGEKMSFRSPMSGAMAYAISAVPGYATTFVVKSLLKKTEPSQQYDLFTSFAAGGLSGLACSPFEALAQNKQLTHSTSSKETAQKMVLQRGYQGFFQGGAAVMLREGLWSTVYLTAIPMMSQFLQQQGVKKHQAELFSVLSVAGTFGLLSSPLNQLRFKKQQGLTQTTPSKTYLEHAKDIWNQDPTATSKARTGFFFRACVQRAVTTTLAAGLMVKGTEVYNQTVDSFRK